MAIRILLLLLFQFNDKSPIFDYHFSIPLVVKASEPVPTCP